jgi:hypothetical protein
VRDQPSSYGEVRTETLPAGGGPDRPSIRARGHPGLLGTNKRADPSVDGFGLLVRVGRATADGFEWFEVWESKEH